MNPKHLTFQVPATVRDRLAWQTEQMYYVRHNEEANSSNYPWQIMRINADGSEIQVRIFRAAPDAVAYVEGLSRGIILDPKSPTMKGETK